MKRNYLLVTNIGDDTRYLFGCILKPKQSIVTKAGIINTLLGMVDYPWIKVTSDFSEHSNIVSRVEKATGHYHQKYLKHKEGVGYYYEINRAASV
jgi:hypothetical protein